MEKNKEKAIYEKEMMFELNSDSEICYLVPFNWMLQWRMFIKTYGTRPEIIDVKSLLDDNGKLKKNLKMGASFIGVNQNQWEFLKSIYSCNSEFSQNINELTTRENRPETAKNHRKEEAPNEKNEIFHRETVEIHKKTKPKLKINIYNENLEKSGLEEKKEPNDKAKFSENNSKVLTNFKDSYRVQSTNASVPKKECHVYKEEFRPTTFVELTSKKKQDSSFSSEKTETFSRSTSSSTQKNQNSVTNPEFPTKITANFQISLFGLSNPQFQCYLNTTLQCLFSLSEFCAYLLKQTSSESLTKSFLALILNKNNLQIQSAAKICEYFTSKFPKHKQHDAPEFLRIFLEKINTESEKPLPSRPNNQWEIAKSKYSEAISNFFLGLLRSTVKCKHCSNQTYSHEPFIILILNLKSSLHQSLSDFTSRETICGQYLCEKCKKKRDIVKWYEVLQFPKYLVIQLKRFQMSSQISKIDSRCRFDEVLTIDNQNVYSLVAVTVHAGGVSGGHYYAYCKRDQWYCFNDSSFYRVELTTVLDSQAYLLFYVRQN